MQSPLTATSVGSFGTSLHVFALPFFHLPCKRQGSFAICSGYALLMSYSYDGPGMSPWQKISNHPPKYVRRPISLAHVGACISSVRPQGNFSLTLCVHFSALPLNG